MTANSGPRKYTVTERDDNPPYKFSVLDKQGFGNWRGGVMSDGTLGWIQKLDPKIRKIVAILHCCGIETFESCQGGKGHAFLEPTVRFHGTYEAGFRALALCFTYGIRVSELRRVWRIEAGEPKGPKWELTFWENQPELADMTKGKGRV